MHGFVLFRFTAIAALILANGFFVAAEFALVSLRRSRVEQLIAEGATGARAVERLQARLDDFLPAVQLGVTLCSLALGWVGEPTVAMLLDGWFGKLPDASVYAHLLSAALAFVIITYFHVLLGELVPKSLALRRGEELATGVAAPMLVFIAFSTPVVRVMNRSARVVLHLFRTPQAGHGGSLHSAEELKLITTSARESGVLQVTQEEFIHRSLEAGEVTTREIMTPRQRIVSLPASMPIEQASARFIEELHSRIPVYDPLLGPEAIIGIVYAKDIARLMHFHAMSGTQGTLMGMQLRSLMREILVVPETKPVFALIGEFQERRRHLAIVVDEFGSTVGLVTVEDAIEQLIGELEDEYDVDAIATPPLPTLTQGLVLDGTVNLRDLETQMRWKLSREAGVETLAGFVLWRMGRIPHSGESVLFDGHRLTVVEMEGRRISKIRVEQQPTA